MVTLLVTFSHSNHLYVTRINFDDMHLPSYLWNTWSYTVSKFSIQIDRSLAIIRLRMLLFLWFYHNMYRRRIKIYFWERCKENGVHRRMTRRQSASTFLCPVRTVNVVIWLTWAWVSPPPDTLTERVSIMSTVNGDPVPPRHMPTTQHTTRICRFISLHYYAVFRYSFTSL